MKSLFGQRFCIVPGHAGKDALDPGSTSPKGQSGPEDRHATFEVEHTIRMAEWTAAALGRLGASTTIIVGEVSATVEQINDINPTAAISLHLNAAIAGAHGMEVWVPAASPASDRLASGILAAATSGPTGLRFRSRGIKRVGVDGNRASSFLSPLTVPVVLFEPAFLTNTHQEKLIHSRMFLEHISTSIGAGVFAWTEQRFV